MTETFQVVLAIVIILGIILSGEAGLVVFKALGKFKAESLAPENRRDYLARYRFMGLTASIGALGFAAFGFTLSLTYETSPPTDDLATYIVRPIAIGMGVAAYRFMLLFREMDVTG